VLFLKINLTSSAKAYASKKCVRKICYKNYIFQNKTYEIQLLRKYLKFKWVIKPLKLFVNFYLEIDEKQNNTHYFILRSGDVVLLGLE